MTIVAKLYKVTCNFGWQTEDETSTWHCATLDGAYRFIEKQKELRWYSIEENTFIPCDENDPDGQLYIGCNHFEFHECE